MSISICIPTYNRLPHLKRLLNSIFKEFGNYPYEIIVADGGSTDGTIEYLKSFNNITLIRQKELKGVVRAYNACFKLTKYKYILWPSDDFVLVPKVLIKACKLMDRYPEIGAVSPKVRETLFWNFPGFGVRFRSPVVLSETHIFRASVLKKFNYLDEAFKTYFVDGDSYLSVLQLGYATIFTREVGIIHNRFEDELRRINKKNRTNPDEIKYFRKKWADFELKLNEHLQLSPFKRYKTLFFKIVRHILRKSPWLLRPMMRRNYAFAHTFYDWLLKQCIVFEAKEYNHLKDFYLAQKIPKRLIQKEKNGN